MSEKHVVRAIILNQREEILLNRRASGHLSGKWEIPGGLVEEGENPKDASEREVFEEVGLIFDAKELFKRERANPKDSIYTWLVDYYSGEATGTLKLDPNEVSEAEYVSESKIDNYDFAHSGVKQCIVEFFTERKKGTKV